MAIAWLAPARPLRTRLCKLFLLLPALTPLTRTCNARASTGCAPTAGSKPYGDGCVANMGSACALAMVGVPGMQQGRRVAPAGGVGYQFTALGFTCTAGSAAERFGTQKVVSVLPGRPEGLRTAGNLFCCNKRKTCTVCGRPPQFRGRQSHSDSHANTQDGKCPKAVRCSCVNRQGTRLPTARSDSRAARFTGDV